jgi:hypothetical protein
MCRNGWQYNQDFFCDHVSPNWITGIKSDSHWKTLHMYQIHLDTTCLYNSRQSQDAITASQVQCLSHPANRPDCVPNDFVFFVYLKEILMDFDSANREKFKTAIINIFEGISKKMLVTIFKSWMNQLKRVIQHEEEDEHKQKNQSIPSIQYSWKKAWLRIYRPFLE